MLPLKEVSSDNALQMLGPEAMEKKKDEATERRVETVPPLRRGSHGTDAEGQAGPRAHGTRTLGRSTASKAGDAVDNSDAINSTAPARDVEKQRMLIKSPGLYREFDGDAYFADPCPAPSLSQSVAKILIEQSPLHAKMAHPRLAPPVEDDDDEPEKYVKALAIGNAAHKLMLGRGKMIAVLEFDDFKKKVAQEAKQEAIAAGCEPILKKHHEVAERMVLAARGQLSLIEGCERAFREGDAEVVVAACEDGLWLRSMIDWITPDLREVWDLKTSGMSASPYNTGKLMASAGWHLQAAMHERILDAIDPQNAGRRRFLYVCQENEAPYAITVNEIGEAALTIGRKMIDYAANVWRRCLETGYWPAYPLRIIRPELPAWHETSWLSREVAEEDVRLKIAARKDFDPKLIMAG